MKTQHTPGPWYQIPGKPLIVECQNKEGYNLAIADCSTSFVMTDSEAKANARLISAAPELLAALEEAGEALTSALSVINAEDDPGKAYPKTRESISNAQGKRFAAIARATS